MPKHSSSGANKALGKIKRTRSIRKKKPGYAVAFATARVEGDKGSAVVAAKLGKARSDIKNFGITANRAEKIKDQTAGYAWFDDGAILLSMEQGTFDRARGAMLDFFKSQKAGQPLIRKGELSPETVADIEAADEAEIEALLEEEGSEEQDETAASAPTPAVGPSDEPAVPVNEAAAASVEAVETPAPVPEQVRVGEDDPREKLSEEQLRTAQKSTAAVTAILTKALARVEGITVPERAALASTLEARLIARMANLDDAGREKLLETGPSRLLMAVSRDTLLGRTGNEGIVDPLEAYAPDHPVSSKEVKNHFCDLASRNIRKNDRTGHVARHRVEQRVDGFFSDDMDPQKKLEALQRLSMTLLPVMKNNEQLVAQFGGPGPLKLENLPKVSVAMAGVMGALGSSLSQLEACRAAFDRGLQQEQGEGMAGGENAYFEKRMEALDKKTREFIARAEGMEGAGGLSAEQHASLQGAAESLMSYVTSNFTATDECDPAYNPTSVRATYRAALQRVVAVPKAAA